MVDYIYIISCQRGQKSPEIYSIWTTYESAIINYYECVVHDGYYLDFMYLYKYPTNVKYCEYDDWSNIKLSKSCKHRMKFKDFKELENIYQDILRKMKLKTL